MKYKAGIVLLVAIAAAGVSGSTVAARNPQEKKQEAKALPGESQIVLAQWNEIGRKLMAMAQDWPEDKYDYKVTPAVRSFAEQLLHVANGMYYFTNPVQDKRRHPKRSGANTKAKMKWSLI